MYLGLNDRKYSGPIENSEVGCVGDERVHNTMMMYLVEVFLK